MRGLFIARRGGKKEHMSWDAVAATASTAGVVVTVLVGVYNSGKVRQKLDDNNRRTSENTRKLEDHEGRIRRHDVKIGKFEEWKDGYNAASRVSVSRDPNPIL